MPEVGRVVGDKYRLERLIARGGMGSVWRAEHLELGMPVAVKFLRTDLVGADRPEARFVREARALARIQSPHVVQVLDFGRSPEAAYLVMEFLEGQDLGLVLEHRGALEPEFAVVLAAQAARGLAAAHQCALVHRDLKPSNLFLTGHLDAPVLKLIDFGIAKQLDVSDGETTRAGTILGSPAYMSPEQARDSEVGAASDLWSLSAVLYRMLTGERPFSGANDHDLIVRICTTDVAAPSTQRPGLSTAFDAFFDGALSRDRSRRPATLAQWQTALLAACASALHSEAGEAARREVEGLGRHLAAMGAASSGSPPQETTHSASFELSSARGCSAPGRLGFPGRQDATASLASLAQSPALAPEPRSSGQRRRMGPLLLAIGLLSPALVWWISSGSFPWSEASGVGAAASELPAHPAAPSSKLPVDAAVRSAELPTGAALPSPAATRPQRAAPPEEPSTARPPVEGESAAPARLELPVETETTARRGLAPVSKPGPTSDTPGSDAPGSDAPGSDAPGSDAPGSNAPPSPRVRGTDSAAEESPRGDSSTTATDPIFGLPLDSP